MTYQGHIRNGAIVLDGAVPLPEGAAVRVDVALLNDETECQRYPTLAERLGPFIGAAEGLPADAALNHDHYLYGVPKK